MNLPPFPSPAPLLVTERLTLRPLEISDAPAVQKQFERWEVVRYLNKSVPWPYPPTGAEDFLQNVLFPNVAAGREAAWGLRLDAILIGVVSLSCDGDENRGFWLAPEYWGRGLMTEACNRVTAYAMQELKWPHLVTGNAVTNVASGRLKHRQGFERTAVFPKEFVGGWMHYEQWRLTRERWVARSEKP